MEKLTEKLAEFCENIKFEKLPKDVVERTCLLYTSDAADE